MHLKCLEISGFKSFPVRTRLEFGKGMTAIVGPNGCGKSNVSDAIRWVLGEQSAKLLRGTKMEDCIFNGTDDKKPLGMAEVSLTFSDCEGTVDTEFNEITLTRRVFRSGEGQYFINKTPCRLRDIQRLFMDTGVGTNSYSLMEQGRVDLILSSRPEDRRAVFEEASGITKYKTDKREALRKLEQTEANLVRLADVIKEVKRQIISLQRQAGKARRVKALREELRGLDIFVSRERLKAMDSDIGQLDAQAASNRERIEAFQSGIEMLEQANESLRGALSEAEQEIAAAAQEEGELRSRLERAERLIVAGELRVEELRELLKRDSSDAEKAASELDQQRRAFESALAAMGKAKGELEAAEKELNEKMRLHAEHEQAQEKMRLSIESFYSESMEFENRMLKLQNRHHDMEVHDRSTASRRERTAAEQANLARVLDGYEKRLAEFVDVLGKLKEDAAVSQEALSAATAERDALDGAAKAAERKRAECMLKISAAEARLDIIRKGAEGDGAFPAGAMRLLDESNPLGIARERVLGALCDQVEAPPEFRTPLETALRPVLDAIVVFGFADGLDCLRKLEAGDFGPARLLAMDVPGGDAPGAPDEGAGVALLDKITCPEKMLPLARRLLAGVRVVENLDDVPSTIPRGVTYVTFGGALACGSGAMELYRRDSGSGNPLARKHQLLELDEKMTGLKSELAACDAELAGLVEKRAARGESVADGQAALAEAHKALARKEGEYQGLSGQADRIRENFETVSFELQELEKEGSSVEERSAILKEIDEVRSEMARVKDLIAKRKAEHQEMEQERRKFAAAESDARVSFAQRKQAAEHLTAQHGPLEQRIADLESLVKDRTARSVSYSADIEAQLKAVAGAREQLPAVTKEMENNASRMSELRGRRTSAQASWQRSSDELKAKRGSLDEVRERQNEINGRLIEQRMKRQAMMDRVTSEHRIAPDAIAGEPEPQWSEEGRPDMETLENKVGELRARIEAIGPVYDGAIDEYQQLEERHTFLLSQQDDLVKSKQQLMDMIRKINQTTTDMFAQTFDVINKNFQVIFKQLFGGGSAKLMLADEEDVLESGIEIIARPPGKPLQSVSLLSGGERALTAVSLLFAIYMFKPSPFCVLDELDAPLDETNIGRFIKMLQGFLEQSQFVVITHNRQTISAASVLYGVTMEEFGVSKIVSMRFAEREDETADKSVKKPEDVASLAESAVQ